ncbi:MAG TPA: hypothetical protein VFZ09_09685 [Archangium sp.]|uniref:hypothetical protein n=1 Tax=Archangium sp. TaxID=1872627 RepID=UPI002E3533DF|nr:hypothetical protein [Archangium sp.]HEX5746504.1 hypothetical protein [Archangium sp.]
MSYAQTLEAVPLQVPSPRHKLPFLRDDRLRNIAERDLSSLLRFKNEEEVKVVLIMAGSVIEAVLLDCFQRFVNTQLEAVAKQVQARRVTDGRFSRFSPERRESWSFFHSIAVAGPDGLHILRGRTERVADTLRNFRNLVHPARELLESDDSPLRTTDADAAVALVGMVLDDVQEWVMTR